MYLGTGGRIVNGLSGDLSITGLLIKCYEELDDTSNEPLQLTLPAISTQGGCRELCEKTKIVRKFQRDGYYHYAVEFISTGERVKENMRQIIRYFKKHANFA